MDRPTVRLAIVMERVAIENRWQPYRWQAVSALDETEVSGSAPQTIVRHDDLLQRVYPGMELVLFKDEAEGYYLNLTSPDPRIFVMWRVNEDKLETEEEAEPFMLTLSYNEAARWMDAQEKVDGIPIIPALMPWLSAFVEEHYKPEVKKQRLRPKSFESKEGRYKNMS
jgi:hypothetical protein